MSSTPTARVLSALRASGFDPRASGTGWACRCPAHDDRSPSLSISEGDDGRALLHCHAGCATDAIVAAIGLSLKDLMPSSDTQSRGSPPRTTPEQRIQYFRSADAAVEDLTSWRGSPSAVWFYHNAAGDEVGRVLRWNRPGGKKQILPVSLTKEGWAAVGMPGVRPLYRLPELLSLPKGARVFIVEGEKCADAAVGIGLHATTSPHGSQSPQKADWSPLAGKEVVILPDSDKAGGEYAKKVARLALEAGAASVRIVPLTGLAEGEDLVDFIATRNGSRDAVVSEIETFIAAASPEGHLAAPASPPPFETWPNPRPLPSAMTPVMPFDPNLLPDAVREYVIDIAERVQCPIDYPAVAIMVGLSALIGRKVGIRPKREDDWLVVPNLWGAVVGRPGVMKTPAISEPLKPIKRLEVLAKTTFEEASAKFEATKLLSEAKRKERDRKIQKAINNEAEARRLAMESLAPDGSVTPVRKRYIVNDSTVEKLGEILRDNPMGVLIFRDELIGFLKNLEKEGNESSRGFFLEAWNGNGRYAFDRIGRGTVDIDAAIASILGGIQPGPLCQYLRGVGKDGIGDDGLIQRFQLLVWPDICTVFVNIDRAPNAAARARAVKVFEGLDGLEAALIGADNDPFEVDGIPFLRFDADAQAVFDAWRVELETAVRSGDLHPAFESHKSKFRSLIPSLALIIHLADGGSGPVPRAALDQAIGWGKYLETHAQRMYNHVVRPHLAAARVLAKHILDGDLKDGFALRDVYRHNWTGLSNNEETKGAVEVLLDLDWLCEIKSPTAGRTATPHFINPKLAGSEAAQSIRAQKRTAKADKGGPADPSGSSGGPDLEGGTDFGPEGDWGTL